MRHCTCCKLPAAPNATSRPMVWPHCYYLLWECSGCQSTLAVTMWESEEE